MKRSKAKGIEVVNILTSAKRDVEDKVYTERCFYK